MVNKILIIEDEINLLETLKLNLELENYSVLAFDSGIEALKHVELFSPHLILLDIMLPVMSGTDVFKKIKELNINCPIIFLTAKNNVKDKIDGLKLGADDYITKPFDLEELLLRINIALKRNNSDNEVLSVYKFNNCEINFSNYTVIKQNGESETLSKREIAFLKLLIENKNTVISREEILQKLWNFDENPSSRTIDNYILGFRKFFEPNQKEPTIFQSIRGVGYKFNHQ